MLLEHECIFSQNVFKFFLEAGIVLSMDEVVLEEDKLVDFLLCLFILLFLCLKLLAAGLILRLKAISFFLQHADLELKCADLAFELPLAASQLVLKIANSHCFLVDFL
jgi:hypothetical protein